MGGRGRKGAQAENTGDLFSAAQAAERAAAEKAAKRTQRKTKAASGDPSPRRRFAYFLGRWFGVGVEGLALGSAGLVAMLLLLSRTARYVTGESPIEILLAMAGAVVALCIATPVLLLLWLSWRRFIVRVTKYGPRIPLAVALCIGFGAVYSWATTSASADIRALQNLVSSSVDTERAAIAHQVFAHYRRSNLEQTSRLISRGMPYDATVREAAIAFGVSHEILMGIAATESSFLPRRSKDGGEGLFQITKPPKAALEAAKNALGVETLDVAHDHRHNIYVGAATYEHYFRQMNEDLFLALLAYNIGPHNGGLRSIMRDYGATNYVRIQPYLKDLPRDYPIRVLSAALAYRVWTRNFGQLPRYEDGDNAKIVQEIGVPGLEKTGGMADFVAGLE